MRFFTVSDSATEFKGGRYAAKDNVIGTAARKAGARLYRNLSDSEIKKRSTSDGIKFSLRETTRGSKKNSYNFIVKREILSVPVLIKKKIQSPEKKPFSDVYATAAEYATEHNNALIAELEEKKAAAPKSDAEIYVDLVKDVNDLVKEAIAGKRFEVGYIIYNKYVVKSAPKTESPSGSKKAASKETGTKKKAKTAEKKTAAKPAAKTAAKTATKTATKTAEKKPVAKSATKPVPKKKVKK